MPSWIKIYFSTSYYHHISDWIENRKKSIQTLKWLANQTRKNDDVKFPWNTFLPLWGEKERPKRNAKMRDWGSTNFPPSSELMYLGKLRRTFFIWRRTLIVFYGLVYLHDLCEWWSLTAVLVDNCKRGTHWHFRWPS